MSQLIAFVILSLIAIGHALPTDLAVKSWRIVGGIDASEHDAPHQVSLRSVDNIHFCGGSIITTRAILTAAHCVDKRPPSNVRAVIGSIYLNSGGITHEIDYLVSHPEYDSTNIINDVGIAVTSLHMIFDGSTVAAIPLSYREIDGEYPGTLTGWGSQSYPGTAANHLQKLTVNTISLDDCKKSFLWLEEIHESQICTYTKPGEGTCHGDSGGPLVVDGKLVGVVSWGFPCAIGFPDVFTRVSYFYGWIASHVDK